MADEEVAYSVTLQRRKGGETPVVIAIEDYGSVRELLDELESQLEERGWEDQDREAEPADEGEEDKF